MIGMRDEDLLMQSLRLPDSAAAKISREILQYRAYRQTLKYNRAVLALSILVGVATVLSLLVAAATFRAQYNKSLLMEIVELFTVW